MTSDDLKSRLPGAVNRPVTGKIRRTSAKAGTEAIPSHMSKRLSPEVVVQRQLDAYNARDLEAWLATYAEDARQFEFPAKVLATGHAEIRARTAARLQEPNIHAKLLKRSVMGSIVIDQEEVTRTFPEGPGRIELVCIYEVREGKIQNASFVFGAKTLESSV